jgi:hypothetical protein
MPFPSRSIHIDNAPAPNLSLSNRHSLRIALRLWGFDESAAKSRMSESPTLNGHCP